MNDDPCAVDILYAKIEPGPEQEKYLISWYWLLLVIYVVEILATWSTIVCPEGC